MKREIKESKKMLRWDKYTTYCIIYLYYQSVVS